MTCPVCKSKVKTIVTKSILSTTEKRVCTCGYSFVAIRKTNE